MELRRGRRLASNVALLLLSVSIALLFSCALLSDGCSWSASLGIRSSRTVSFNQGWGRGLRERPGSFPPLCAAKCERCTPCRPVHMIVPPGRPSTMEYYPEAWRCRCGNKLYMP